MIRYIFNRLWLLFATLTILAAVLFSIGRVLFPQVIHYQKDIELMLGEALGQPLSVGEVDADWVSGIGPQLRFERIAFLDPGSGKEAVSFEEASVAIDVAATLLTLQLRFGELTLSGLDLEVLRMKNGAIEVGGFSGRADDRAVAVRVPILKWLLAQHRLSIRGSRLSFRDETGEIAQMLFEGVNLELRNAGKRHQFDGTAILPESMGKRISFAMDLRGDFFASDEWSGETFVDAEGVIADAAMRYMPEGFPLYLHEGVADLQLWMKWKAGELDRVDGHASGFSLRVASARSRAQKKQTLKIDALSGRIAWQRRANGWEAAADRLVLARDGRIWPFTHLNFALRRLHALNEVEMSADYLNVEDVMAFAGLSDRFPDQARDYIRKLRPRGDMHQVHMMIREDEQGLGLHAHGAFEDVAFRSHKGMPAMQGVDGVFAVRNDAGLIDLVTRDAVLTAPDTFRDSLKIEQFDGRVAWKLAPEGAQVVLQDMRLANADLRTRLYGRIDIPDMDGVTPYVDIEARFETPGDTLGRTGRYLPVNFMRPGTVEWIEQSVLRGQITRGSMVYRGRTGDFPFRNGRGKAEVRADVQGGGLRYAKNWPLLTDLKGEVAFTGARLEVDLKEGRSFSSAIRRARVELDDIVAQDRVLRIRGSAHGSSADVLRYLSVTPLKEDFGDYIEGMSAEGASRLDLALDIPLGNDDPAIIKGTLSLLGSKLFMADRAVDFTSLRGKLDFDNEGVNSPRITGQVMGLPATFSVRSIPRSGEDSLTLVEASGSAKAEDLHRLLDITLLRHLQGQSDWQALMYLFGGDRGRADLTVTSALEGLSSPLPYPVAKQAEHVWPLTLAASFPAELDEPLRFSIEGLLNGVLDMSENMDFERGEVRFGPGPVTLPEQQGLRLAGHLDALSVTQWYPHIEEAQESDSGEEAGINQINARVGLLEFFDYPFSNVTLNGGLNKAVWDVQMRSDELAGKITIPLGPVLPVSLNLDYLKLASIDSEDEEDIDPREFPGVRLNSKQFIYDGVNFGELALVAVKRPQGLHLDRFRMSSRVMTIDASGDWLYIDNEHYSSFSIRFDSKNFGKAMGAMGFAGTIKGGRSDIDVIARWPGSPASFALERLNGTMRIKVADGRLLDVEPGAGRLLGLLSLQALPRRLVLDFRDLFQKGFSFDVLKGNFSFKDGHAVTSDLYMDGPAARIDARGRIGMAARDYDQRVYVKPNVDTGLPAALALTGDPITGAAILFFQELLKPSLKKAGGLEYRITGSWDNPDIVEIKPDEKDRK